MPIFPFFQYPYNMNQYYPRNNIYSKKNDYIDNVDENNTSKKAIHFQNPFSMDGDKPIIEILGISLYLDDIIILALLFFLYQEGVKDYMLYLALIMLLLS